MKKILMAGAMTLAFSLITFVATANATLVFDLGGCDFSSDPGGTGACGGSGDNLPNSAVTMTFEQFGINTVRLTINAGGMPTGTGKISDIWFNSTVAFGNLSFAHVSGVATDQIQAGGNVFGAVGIFDINFEYITSGVLGDLYYGLTSVYDISGTGLVENDFNDLSTGGFKAVMHVNITGNGDSGHYVSTDPVPEPATMFLLGTGLTGLAAIRRNKNS